MYLDVFLFVLVVLQRIYLFTKYTYLFNLFNISLSFHFTIFHLCVCLFTLYFNLLFFLPVANK